MGWLWGGSPRNCWVILGLFAWMSTCWKELFFAYKRRKLQVYQVYRYALKTTTGTHLNGPLEFRRGTFARNLAWLQSRVFLITPRKTALPWHSWRADWSNFGCDLKLQELAQVIRFSCFACLNPWNSLDLPGTEADPFRCPNSCIEKSEDQYLPCPTWSIRHPGDWDARQRILVRLVQLLHSLKELMGEKPPVCRENRSSTSIIIWGSVKGKALAHNFGQDPSAPSSPSPLDVCLLAKSSLDHISQTLLPPAHKSHIFFAVGARIFSAALFGTQHLPYQQVSLGWDMCVFVWEELFNY